MDWWMVAKRKLREFLGVGPIYGWHAVEMD